MTHNDFARNEVGKSGEHERNSKVPVPIAVWSIFAPEGAPIGVLRVSVLLKS